MTTLDDGYEEMKVNTSHEVSDDDNLFLIQIPKDFSLDSLHDLRIPPFHEFLEKKKNIKNDDNGPDKLIKRIKADYLNYNIMIKNNKQSTSSLSSSSSSSDSDNNNTDNNLEEYQSNILRAIKYNSENGKNTVGKPFKGVISIVRDILDVQDKHKGKSSVNNDEDFTSEAFKSQLIDNYGKRQQLTGLSLSNIPFGSDSSLDDVRKRKRTIIDIDTISAVNITNTKSSEKKSKKEKKEKKGKKPKKEKK